jgi:hypothetical protein
MSASAAPNRAAVVYFHSKVVGMGKLGNPDIIQLGMLDDFGGDSESPPTNTQPALPVNMAVTGFVVGLLTGVVAMLVHSKYMVRGG